MRFSARATESGGPESGEQWKWRQSPSAYGAEIERRSHNQRVDNAHREESHIITRRFLNRASQPARRLWSVGPLRLEQPAAQIGHQSRQYAHIINGHKHGQ